MVLGTHQPKFNKIQQFVNKSLTTTYREVLELFFSFIHIDLRSKLSWSSNMGIKGVSSAPGDFIYFKSQVPLHRIPVRFSLSLSIPFFIFLSFPFPFPRVFFLPLSFLSYSFPYLLLSQIGTKQWRYYDFGPKVVPPLICLPGIAGTADVYYKQIMFLSMKVLLPSYFHFLFVFRLLPNFTSLLFLSPRFLCWFVVSVEIGEHRLLQGVYFMRG